MSMDLELKTEFIYHSISINEIEDEINNKKDQLCRMKQEFIMNCLLGFDIFRYNHDKEEDNDIRNEIINYTDDFFQNLEYLYNDLFILKRMRDEIESVREVES